MDILLRVELSVPDSTRDVVVVVTYAATSTNATQVLAGWLAGRPPKTPASTPAHSLTQVALDLA